MYVYGTFGNIALVDYSDVLPLLLSCRVEAGCPAEWVRNAALSTESEPPGWCVAPGNKKTPRDNTVENRSGRTNALEFQ